MKNKKIMVFIFLLFLSVVLVLLFFSDSIIPNRLKSDVASSINSRKKKTIKVATFNVGSWKCGDGNQGATCKNNNNTAISKLIKDKGIDIVGVQEAGEHLASYRISELASMSNMSLKYVQPLQINALLSKYSMTTGSSNQYLGLPSCSESRALIKQVINIDGINISFYNTHLSYEPECNEYHFREMAKIVSQDKNPIVIMGDYNRIPIDYFNKYLKPNGFEVAAYDKNFSNKKTSSYADAIFIRSKGQIEVLSSETINTFNNYSDHNMVMATLSIKEPSIKVNFHYNGDTDTTVTEVFNKSSKFKKFGYNSAGNPIYPMTGQYGKWDRAGYKLLGWSKEKKSTKADYGVYSGVADWWIEDNEPVVDLYAVWEPYKLNIKYDVNGGVVKEYTNSEGYKFSKNGSLVTINGNVVTYTLKYGESMPVSGLANYNNDDYIKITKSGYTAIPGKEWKDKNGKEYSQSKQYKASDFSTVCDVSKNTCDVIFYVNWKKVVNIPNTSSCNNLTYNGSNQTLINGVEGVTLENNTRTAAGSQTVTAKLKSGYAWSDSTDGNKAITCSIKQYNLSSSSVTGITTQTYTGSAIEPKPTVTAFSKKLTLNTDYTLSYSSNTNAGTATITITGKGNYTGTKSITFIIAKKSITVPTYSNKTYNAKEQSITAGTGYTLSGTVKGTNVNTYTATAVLSDKSNTQWSDKTTTNKSITWKIVAYNISNTSVGSISDLFYTGSAIEPKPKVTALNKTLTLNTDYTLSYKNNVNAGTATITITGKGNYTGTKTTTFVIKNNKKSIIKINVPSYSNKTYNTKEQSITTGTGYTLNGTTRATNTGTYKAIAKLSDKTNTKWSDGTTTDKTITWKIVAYIISNASVSSISNQTYTGSAIKPTPKVTALNKTLTLNTDYTLSYKNNVNAGTATITITGKGNYTGTKSITFTIAKKSITVPTYSNKTYNAKEQSITAGTGYTLSGTVKGTDVNTYTATAVLSDKSNTQWSDKTTTNKSITWKIVAYNISNASVGSISNQTYTGSAIKPTPTVTALSKTLVLGTDYSLSYKDNTSVGTATITITGKGNYTGSKTATFVIENSKTTYSIKSKDTKYYNVKNNKIYVKFSPVISKISVSNLVNNFTIIGNYYVKDKNNKKITGIEKVTTGSKLQLGNKDYQVVIYGDVDRDGIITMSDLYEMFKHIKKTSILTGDKFDASDYIQDSSINMADLYEVFKKIKKKS